MSTAPYRVLLYYKYVAINDFEQFAQEHLALCKSLGLKGRILIAPEGINGTVSGTVAQTEQYMDWMHDHPLFHDIVFKVDEATAHAFKKMFVRARTELVTFRLEDDVDPTKLTGKRLNPKQFHEAIQQEDVIILDGRNDYEYDVGHFRGAIRPAVESFREFPAWIRQHLGEHKHKKIVTYCTGGIRCEKLSGFLLREGFEDVSQLDGGIVTYGKDPEVQGERFDGKCYVFDERIVVPINRTAGSTVVGTCIHCGTKTERYINCTYDFCHHHHLVCAPCEEAQGGYCSAACRADDEVLQASRCV
jgi:UPF0176 protein